MVQINIYKLDSSKYSEFLQEVSKKFEKRTTKILKKIIHREECEFGLTLYISKPSEEKDVKWNWILKEFNEKEIKNVPNSKAILLIEKSDAEYAITFGFSYFIVDKFCDREFAFNFGRKMNYKDIKTTALTSPNTQRNKTINTYINYKSLEFDSGESFTKIKAKIEEPDGMNIFNDSIEIGNSLKFHLLDNKLDTIIELIIYIEDVIKNEKDKVKIPVFSVVKEDGLIKLLDDNMLDKFSDESYEINFSEVDIIGANEIFNHNDTSYEACFKGARKVLDELNYNNIKIFIDENNFNINNILDIKIISSVDGNKIRTDKIKQLIDYTDETEKCILSKGMWYRYNDDYLHYLKESISEIDIKYNKIYDLSKKDFEEYQDLKYKEEKDDKKYEGKSDKEIRKSIKATYYREKYYNTMLENRYGFRNLDRDLDSVGSSRVEIMDLYKDNTMFAVKIGSTSGKLCYVVDQSLEALKVYKHNLTENKPKIENVAIWIILQKAKKLKLIDGKPDLNELDMLILKNKLDGWKKEVRVLGYKPIIYLNYEID